MGLLQRLFGSPTLPGKLSETDGFVDIDLPLTKVEVAGIYSLQCLGQIESQLVGFGVTLDAEWTKQQLEGSDATVLWGFATVLSLGSPSNELVSLLATRYGHNSLADRHMLQQVRAQVVCLGGDPRSQPKESLQMKFFFNVDDEKRYAEVFVNVDLDSAVIEFHEKDNDYRLTLLRSLTEA